MDRFLLLLPCVFLAACSTYKAPTLGVTDASLAEQSADGIVLRFTLDATNANEVELPLREIAYTVRIDGREVFRGVRSPEATLRRLGTQEIVIPAAIPIGAGSALGPGLPAGSVRFEIEGKLSYTTPGSIAQVLFDTGVRRPSVHFRQEGDVELTVPEPGAPSPAPAAPPETPPPGG